MPGLRLRHGLTLVELMIGLVVTGLVVATGYAAFAATIDRRNDAARAAEQVARATGVRRTLQQWVTGARPVVVNNQLDQGALTELRVQTYAATPMRSPLTNLRLFVDNGSSGMGQGLVAMLRADTGMDSLRITLDPFATGMWIEYLVSVDGVLRWRSLAQLPEEQIPVAVRLQIVSEDPSVAAGLSAPIEIPLAMQTAR